MMHGDNPTFLAKIMKFMPMDTESSISGLHSSSIRQDLICQFLHIVIMGNFMFLFCIFCVVCKLCVMVRTTRIFKIKIDADEEITSCYCHQSSLPVPCLPSILLRIESVTVFMAGTSMFKRNMSMYEEFDICSISFVVN